MTFVTEKFIREIESHTAIWDTSLEEYSDRDARNRIWEEITNAMCEDNLTEIEKKEFGKSLQQKWKNIRTSYSREIKRRAGATSGSAALRKSPYVYFEQLQFLKAAAVNNVTESSVGETRTAESNDDSRSIRAEQPVSKKKKTSDDESLIQVLRESIAAREERERKQERDPDRLFMLSLLQDFKNIPKRRKLSTKMELIDVIKRAQMETQNSEFEMFRQGYVELGTSATKSSRPETSVSGQYRHGYSTQSNYGLEDLRCESHRAYSTSVADRQDNTVYSGALSPTDTNASDTSLNSEIIELF